MGRRSRYVARRRSLMQRNYYTWDHTLTLCTWGEYKREHRAGIDATARLVFNDSVRMKYPAFTEPKNWDGWNRASRRWAWKHRKELLRGAAPSRSSNG